MPNKNVSVSHHNSCCDRTLGSRHVVFKSPFSLLEGLGDVASDGCASLGPHPQVLHRLVNTSMGCLQPCHDWLTELLLRQCKGRCGNHQQALRGSNCTGYQILRFRQCVDETEMACFLRCIRRSPV